MHGKRLGLVSGLAVIGIALAGCSATPAADGPVTLKFIAPEYSDVTGDYWKDLVAAFEADNPDITIDLEMVNWTDIGQKVNTLISTGEEPDILNIDSFASYAGDDLLLPVEDVLPEDTYADLIPALRDNGALDGVNYGLPMLASARALFYNKTIFAEAGITDPPETWAELKDDAQKITDAGYIGYGLPLGAPEAQGEFSIWAWNNGGDWMDGDDWTINSPENVEALDFAASLSADGLTQVNPATTNRDDLFKIFGEGQIGMLEGAVFLPAVLDQQGSTVDYGVAPSPHNEGADSATLGVEDYLMVFKSTEHKEAAGKFLSYFYEADNYTKFLTNEGMLPVTQSAADAMASDPKYGPFIDLLGSAKFYPTTNPIWPDISAEAIATLGGATSGKSAQEVLDALQALAESSSE